MSSEQKILWATFGTLRVCYNCSSVQCACVYRISEWIGSWRYKRLL